MKKQKLLNTVLKEKGSSNVEKEGKVPISSMTGFGSSSYSGTTDTYVCEIRTLNSRFLDVNIRLPKVLAALEPEVIELIKAKMTRGKVEVVYDVSSQNLKSRPLEINLSIAQQYLDFHQNLSSLTPSPEARPLSATDLLKLDGVLQQTPPNRTELIKEHREGIMTATTEALDAVVTERQVEGSKLETALEQLLEGLDNNRKQIESLLPTIRKGLLENTKKRLKNLMELVPPERTSPIDKISEDRVLSEVFILIDKMDIAEELTRLEAHSAEFRSSMNEGATNGRKLDFICQELNREINTVTNKMTHMSVAKVSMSTKQIIERLRQQVQNIE